MCISICFSRVLRRGIHRSSWHVCASRRGPWVWGSTRHKKQSGSAPTVHYVSAIVVCSSLVLSTKYQLLICCISLLHNTGRCPSADNPRTVVHETDCHQPGLLVRNEAGVLVNRTRGAFGNLCHIDCANQGICDHSTGKSS